MSRLELVPVDVVCVVDMVRLGWPRGYRLGDSTVGQGRSDDKRWCR